MAPSSFESNAKLILSRVRGDVAAVIRLVAVVETHFHRNYRRKRPRSASAAAIREIERMQRFLADFLRRKAESRVLKQRALKIRTPEAVNLVSLFVAQIQSNHLMSQMTVAYLVALAEAFFKDYLTCVFKHRPAALKTGRAISTAEALSHRSITSLRKHLASEEVDRLGYGSIDDLANFLEERFKLRVTAFPEWVKVREMFYRRNIIIHNQGIVNAAYRAKFPAVRLGSTLTTTPEYVREAAETIVKVMDQIHEAMLQKLQRGTKARVAARRPPNSSLQPTKTRHSKSRKVVG